MFHYWSTSNTITIVSVLCTKYVQNTCMYLCSIYYFHIQKWYLLFAMMFAHLSIPGDMFTKTYLECEWCWWRQAPKHLPQMLTLMFFALRGLLSMSSFRLFFKNFPANLEPLSWMDTKIGQLLGTLFFDKLFCATCKLPKRYLGMYEWILMIWQLCGHSY